MFEHPYLAMYKRLHEEFGLKIQLNLFYRLGDFNLSQVSDAYYREWEKNSDWLKLSFHSELENVRPYVNSGYDEVFEDCKRVNKEIVRFASPAALAKTTTIHYCLLTEGGLRAVEDNNISGLLGLFGTNDNPRCSYSIDEEKAEPIRNGEVLKIGNIYFASIDIILNNFSKDDILKQLMSLSHRDSIRVMIHEQYFYSDYSHYIPEFENRLRATFAFLSSHDYQSCFFENLFS